MVPLVYELNTCTRSSLNPSPSIHFTRLPRSQQSGVPAPMAFFLPDPQKTLDPLKTTATASYTQIIRAIGYVQRI